MNILREIKNEKDINVNLIEELRNREKYNFFSTKIIFIK